MSGEELRAPAEAALWSHHDRTIDTYSPHHRDNDHESESPDCTEACFQTITICNGCGTRGCSEPLVAVTRALLDERDALRAQVERVRALADHWADFEHDATTCPKYDCGDCTMLNAIYDLRAALDGPA